mmetsp:Transcript_124174/g.397165  ORF Transcript_124174/g.397165 Transcript_124174/m.397165 type:complete len:97 (-) Transcript_124174:50-340(-)
MDQKTIQNNLGMKVPGPTCSSCAMSWVIPRTFLGPLELQNSPGTSEFQHVRMNGSCIRGCTLHPACRTRGFASIFVAANSACHAFAARGVPSRGSA